jgi:Ca2+-binding RTX toxin-like protein
MAKIIDKPGNNDIIGTTLSDVIVGLDQHDTIRGDDGDDVIYGDNQVRGVLTTESSAWFDTLYGERGNDVLFGGAGGDVLDGSIGNDVLHGQLGNNTLTGGGGSDVFVIEPNFKLGHSSDLITDFNARVDKVDVKALGIASFETMHALFTNTRDDSGDGMNTPVAASVRRGGVHYDIGFENLSLDDLTAANFHFARKAVDLNVVGFDNNEDVLFGGFGNDTMNGRTSSDDLYGDRGNDTLIGGEGGDYLNGGRGNDVLLGGATDGDILDGGAGNDILDSGTGSNQTLTGGTGNDVFRFTQMMFDGNIITDFGVGKDVLDISSYKRTKTDPNGTFDWIGEIEAGLAKYSVVKQGQVAYFHEDGDTHVFLNAQGRTLEFDLGGIHDLVAADLIL